MSRVALLAAAVAVAGALALVPEAARGDTTAPSVASVNEGCASCHAEIAAEWSSSLHRRAFRDASFARGYAVEHLAFCRRCHAPLAEATGAEPDAWSADHGVACTSCHGGSPAEAHAKGADLGTRVCAGCHEFGFPEHDSDPKAPAHAPPARLMQKTASEHAASAHASESCASCHLPAVGEGASRHASHRFDVTRNEGVLRNAVVVTARREDGRAVVELATRGVGHAFPTGDMFRRLRVAVEVGEEGRTVARQERFLARSFAFEGGRKVEVADTRVAGTRSVAFPLPAALAAAPVRWSVSYQRLTLPTGTPGRGAERVEEEIVLARGVLASPRLP